MKDKDLTELEVKVLNIILNNPYILISNIAEELYYTPAYIKLIIKRLREKKIIERIGGKNGYWRKI